MEWNYSGRSKCGRCSLACHDEERAKLKGALRGKTGCLAEVCTLQALFLVKNLILDRKKMSVFCVTVQY